MIHMKSLAWFSRSFLKMLAVGLVVYTAWLMIHDANPNTCTPLDQTGLRAQSVYTNLRNPAHVATFNEVSDGIICQCGCNFILSSCPHQECPWGIPVRRFMENQIVQGMSAPEILKKLENGFGPGARQDPIMIGLAQTGRQDLVEKIVHGHGPGISALSSGFLWPISILAIVLGGWLAYTWWQGNRKKSALRKGSPPDQNQASRDLSQNDTTKDPFADLDR